MYFIIMYVVYTVHGGISISVRAKSYGIVCCMYDVAGNSYKRHAAAPRVRHISTTQIDI